MLDLLGSLVAKSLVTASTDERGETRYRLLETVRLYAGEKLDAAEEAAATRARYRDAWIAWLDATPLDHLVLDTDAIAAVGATSTICVQPPRPVCLMGVPTCSPASPAPSLVFVMELVPRRFRIS